MRRGQKVTLKTENPQKIQMITREDAEKPSEKCLEMSVMLIMKPKCCQTQVK